jgi:GT2 family glycosyltransferase
MPESRGRLLRRRTEGGSCYDVVIVHYRDVAGVTELVREIGRWSLRPQRVVVVDNSGELAADPGPMHALGADVVDSPGNPGYGAAVNAGLRHLTGANWPAVAAPDGSGAEYVLLATQDARAAEDAVEHLIRCLRNHPDTAVAAPLVVFRTDPDVVFSAGGMLDAKGRTYHAAFKTPAARWKDHADFDVAWADGAFLLVRTSALDDAGGFRDDFFLYFEEVEFQLRLRLRGWSVRLVPAAICAQQPGNFTAYLRVRNRMLLLAAFPHYFDRRLRFSLLDVAKTCAMSVRDRRWAGPVWAVRGLVDGLNGVSGRPPRSALRRSGPS